MRQSPIYILKLILSFCGSVKYRAVERGERDCESRCWRRSSCVRLVIQSFPRNIIIYMQRTCYILYFYYTEILIISIFSELGTNCIESRCEGDASESRNYIRSSCGREVRYVLLPPFSLVSISPCGSKQVRTVFFTPGISLSPDIYRSLPRKRKRATRSLPISIADSSHIESRFALCNPFTRASLSHHDHFAAYIPRL